MEKNIVKSIFLIVSTVFLLMGNLYASSMHIIKEVSGFKTPASVTYDGSRIFVSNVGEKLAPIEKDGDGFISLLKKDGDVLEMGYIPKGKDILNAPKEMVIENGILFVTDIDRVLGFNIETRDKVFEHHFSEAKFLNGLVRMGENKLIIADTAINKLFLLDLIKSTYSELKINVKLKGPSGLFFDDESGILMIVEWGNESQPNGRVVQVDLKGNNKAKISKLTGYFNGIVATSKNEYIISDWVNPQHGGILHYYDTSNQKTHPFEELKKISGPGDIYLSKENILWIPAMLEGKVYIVELINDPIGLSFKSPGSGS